MRQQSPSGANGPEGADPRTSERVQLHIDAARGIAGDMLLAALIDLGVPEVAVFEPLRACLPTFRATLSPVERGGCRAVALRVEPMEREPPHRGLAEIEAILAAADLPERAVARARACFRRLAEAEGRVHGVPPERVHFHEIGALDSLVDIIGVMLAIERLDPAAITCSSLPLGSGTVRSAHGLLPVPAPAVLLLLEGLPVHALAVGREVTTPTGAALAATLADRFGDAAPGTLRGSGAGAGSRAEGPGEPPNVLRVWTTAVPAGSVDPAESEVVLLETNLDTASGEEAGEWIDALLGAGALDAWLAPILGKKGRPALLLSALARPGTEEALRGEIFRRTGTLGVRSRRLEREALPRRVDEETVAGHRVRVKRAWRGGELLSERVEHDDLVRIARATGRTLREVAAELAAELRRAGRGRGP